MFRVQGFEYKFRASLGFRVSGLGFGGFRDLYRNTGGFGFKIEAVEFGGLASSVEFFCVFFLPCCWLSVSP